MQALISFIFDQYFSVLFHDRDIEVEVLFYLNF